MVLVSLHGVSSTHLHNSVLSGKSTFKSFLTKLRKLMKVVGQDEAIVSSRFHVESFTK